MIGSIYNAYEMHIKVNDRGTFSFVRKVKFYIILTFLVFSEFLCPGDGNNGVCSGQGMCDEATGTCTCNNGFQTNAFGSCVPIGKFYKIIRTVS